MQKLYEAEIEILNGEYSYNQNKLVYAEDIVEATSKFNKFFLGYYTNGKMTGGYFEFNDGEVIIKIGIIKEVILEDWKDEMFNNNKIDTNLPFCIICRKSKTCEMNYKDCNFNPWNLV